MLLCLVLQVFDVQVGFVNLEHSAPGDTEVRVARVDPVERDHDPQMAELARSAERFGSESGSFEADARLSTTSEVVGRLGAASVDGGSFVPGSASAPDVNWGTLP